MKRATLDQRTLPPPNIVATTKVSTPQVTKGTTAPARNTHLSTATTNMESSKVATTTSSTSPPPTTETDPVESHDSEAVDSHMGQGGADDYGHRQRGSRHKVSRPPPMRKDDSDDNIYLIIGIVVGIVLLMLVIISAAIVLAVHQYRKGKLHLQKGPQLAKKPRKMEAAEIGATKFTHAGALVLDPNLKGPVKHALPSKEGDAETLPTLEFDPKLNEIVDIGSDIEVLKDDKIDSAEDEKCSRMGGLRTMKRSVDRKPQQRKTKSTKPRLGKTARAKTSKK